MLCACLIAFVICKIFSQVTELSGEYSLVTDEEYPYQDPDTIVSLANKSVYMFMHCIVSCHMTQYT